MESEENKEQTPDYELWEMGSCVHNPEVTLPSLWVRRRRGIRELVLPHQKPCASSSPHPCDVSPCGSLVCCTPPLHLENGRYLGDEVAFKVGVDRGAPWNVCQEGDKSLHLVDHSIGKWHFFPVLKGRQAVRAKNLLDLCVHLFWRAKERHEVSFPQW